MNTKDFFLSLSQILDLACPELSNHHLETAYISWCLGEELGLPPEKMHDLFIAALIHDIGAITLERPTEIPEYIFNDSSSNHHEIKGWFLINKNLDNNEVADTIKYHHTDYMELGNEKFLAQIINLAESVDRKIDKKIDIFLQKTYIKGYILNNKGTKFHPDIVDAFITIQKRESFWFAFEKQNIKIILDKIHVKTKPVNNIYRYVKLVRDILEFISPSTASHSVGVMICAKTIGEILGFDSEKLKKLSLAGLLHDVGKLVISEKLLLKKESLNTKESFDIKKHAYYTYLFLKEAGFDNDICEWAGYHHETPEGTGYPFRLKKHELPFESRIIAISDIFVALTENRSYRKGFNKKETKIIIKKIISEKSEHGILDIVFNNYTMILNLIRNEYTYIGLEYQNLLFT